MAQLEPTALDLPLVSPKRGIHLGRIRLHWIDGLRQNLIGFWFELRSHRILVKNLMKLLVNAKSRRTGPGVEVLLNLCHGLSFLLVYVGRV